MLSLFTTFSLADRSSVTLEKNWRFARNEQQGAEQINYDDSKWEVVTVPHDWAIYGPFDHSYGELTRKHVTKYDEKGNAVESTNILTHGETGGLPWVGVGWYRTTFKTTPGKITTLVFDGAMANATVYVNGKKVYNWPYGYNSFHFDVTEYVNPDGSDNVLAVRLENLKDSSRWYPGAGIYRNVYVITTDAIHVPVWGTLLTTPHVCDEMGTVHLLTTIVGSQDNNIRVVTDILGPDGKVVVTDDVTRKVYNNQPFEQNFLVTKPKLWSPETPFLYTASTKIYYNNEVVDSYKTVFGFRKIQFIPEKGFFLNNVRRQFKGVCNHHDLGPLGAAVNVKALRHQLEILKDMGCDSIRTSHNMPCPELVQLCNEMGFMMMVETFDEWDEAKCANGYHRIFNEWAEKDLVAALRHYRNDPAVIMWSIGNEVPSQGSAHGRDVAIFLRNICHREDPTRLITCGMDQASNIIVNGFGAEIDIPGLNYRDFLYEEAYNKLPQRYVLGSETTSTVSSRGTYMFPPKFAAMVTYNPHQSNGYDTEYCSWSNIPDDDFVWMDDKDYMLGHFVWTGFDYLGEPTPYYDQSGGWPSHSSYFGIIDLASIPKDRYYLYRAQWNKEAHTLHIVPHWTWPNRVGQSVPIWVYTDYQKAELFVNGVSQGNMTKKVGGHSYERYRLMWNDVKYQPGKIEVIAYDNHDNIGMVQTLRTAGEPHHIKLESKHIFLKADGKDLAYVTVSVVDKDGNLCPHATNIINFEVTGAGHFKAVANGDATCLELFQTPSMHAFAGMMTCIVQTNEGEAGNIVLIASADGLISGRINLESIK